MTALPPPLQATNFASRLLEERDALKAFIQLLEKEQQVLLNQDDEQLLTLAESKTQNAYKLSTFANDRRQFLNTGSEPADTAAWLLKHAPSSQAVWDEVRELAALAHHLNQTNGEVIQLKLRSNQQALSALLGAAQTTAGLYGQDGQRSIPISGRTLGSG